MALVPARVLGRISVRALDNRGNFALGGLTVLLAVAVGILAVFLGGS